MKTERNILIAFLLNLSFAVFEFFGGIFTGSIAIISDAVHDIGDAASIGTSYFLEKKSKRQPDDIFTYGYSRYSVIGSVITTLILLLGSVIVVYNAIGRLIRPEQIHYNGMILFAVVGTCVNLAAAFFTKGGDSLNQKAVNLHMLEDVLGWIVVLIGAIVMRFTDIRLIDPVMSIGVALFIFITAVSNLKEVLELFLEKTPARICIASLKSQLLQIEDVLDVHHIHIRSMDGRNVCATMHIVTCGNNQKVKKEVRQELMEHGINHATLELECEDEQCEEYLCKINPALPETHHHQHHH